MSPEVIQLVFDALHKGRLMRQAQRTYFRTRSLQALAVSKEADSDRGRAEGADASVVESPLQRSCRGLSFWLHRACRVEFCKGESFKMLSQQFDVFAGSRPCAAVIFSKWDLARSAARS